MRKRSLNAFYNIKTKTNTKSLSTKTKKEKIFILKGLIKLFNNKE